MEAPDFDSGIDCKSIYFLLVIGLFGSCSFGYQDYWLSGYMVIAYNKII